MNYKELPARLVGRIRARDARGYAASAGWKRVPNVNGSIVLYQDPTSDLDQLILPLDAAAPDYARRMAEAVVVLAEREKRPPLEVLNDLLLPPADVLRFSLAEPGTEAGILPLNRGIDLLQGARRALLATACSAIQPQPFHPRLSRAEAEALVEASQLGQTERGSYTISVSCPLNAAGTPEPSADLPLFAALSEQGPDPDDVMTTPVNPPFTRVVTGLLMRSAARIISAVDADDLGPLTRNEPHEEIPLSANLCEALLLMAPNGEQSKLTLSATWSRAIPQPDPKTYPSVVRLRREYFALIEELARSLRPAREPKPSQFIGLVDALLGSPAEDGQVRGDVQFLIFNQEEVTRARATLNANDYRTAWEAHGRGGYVSLSGVLVFNGRAGRIEQVQHFRALTESGVAGV